MSNELKNSWRWRHARSLFLPLILCTIALLVSIAIEIFIYQNLWVLIAEVSLILFILGNLVKLYIQYRKLPHGSKRKMIRTILRGHLASYHNNDTSHRNICRYPDECSLNSQRTCVFHRSFLPNKKRSQTFDLFSLYSVIQNSKN